jgi:hypothetical protein
MRVFFSTHHWLSALGQHRIWKTNYFGYVFFLIDDARKSCLIYCILVSRLRKLCDKQALWRNQFSAFLNAILHKYISVIVLEENISYLYKVLFWANIRKAYF